MFSSRFFSPDSLLIAVPPSLTARSHRELWQRARAIVTERDGHNVLTNLSKFFKAICSSKLPMKDMETLEENIVLIIMLFSYWTILKIYFHLPSLTWWNTSWFTCLTKPKWVDWCNIDGCILSRGICYSKEIEFLSFVIAKINSNLSTFLLDTCFSWNENFKIRIEWKVQ